jgi:UDP-N-acetylglucosamine 2-epimerase (non-hydrolysing)
MSVFGTRPEAIKMAPLVKELEKRNEVESVVCVTAQHREMLDQVLKIFEITPDYDLDIMQERQTITETTTRVLAGLGGLFRTIRPNLVLVHGDTTTTFAAALAAFYSKLMVGHVEAGLRTSNKYEPFPEEMNRVLTSSLADLHFTPTVRAQENLLKEGICPDKIFVTGNTVIDALKYTLSDSYVFADPVLRRLDFSERRIITVTAHRRENFGEPLQEICRAVLSIVDEHADVEVVYPVHMNPVVRETVHAILGSHPRIHLVEPLELRDMHNLLNRSYLVMTDSGGLQEEVPSMGKPVLVLRNVTERPEGIEAGALKLAGTKRERIFELAAKLLTSEEDYRKMAAAVNPFGDGKASQRIVEVILSVLRC